MTATLPVTDLTVADLGALGEVLGSGGQAVVHDAPDLTLPRAPQRLVYKAYKPNCAPRVHEMRDLIALRDRLDEPDRERLDRIATWPLRVVTDNLGIRGVVLPRIPDTYFQDVRLPSGRRDTVVREVQHLFVPAERSRRIGMPTPNWEQRIEICRDFAEALDFLHSPAIDVVFGDISAKNELFRLDVEPRVMFVDCDAVRIHGRVGGRQLNAPDWTPPDPTLNRSTDQYKLALFILRCLTPGDQGSTRLDPNEAQSVLDADGVALLAAAILGPSGNRPTAFDWLSYLSRLLGRPLAPPTLDALEIDRTLVAAGEPVTVRWNASGADVVEVAALGCRTVEVNARPGAGAIEVYPARTGTLTVTARNNCGEVVERTPPIAVVDVARWADLEVPMPRLPLPFGAYPSLPRISVVPVPPVPGYTDDRPAAFDLYPQPPRLPGVDLDEPGRVDVISIVTGGPDLDRYVPRTGVIR